MKKTNHTIRQFNKELIPLILSGKISEKTAKLYTSIAKKIILSKTYLKKSYSKGHLRRIKRVLQLLDRIIQLSKRTASGLLYKVSGVFFSPELKQVFYSFSELKTSVPRLIDAEAGRTLAVIEANYESWMRTGAAGVVALSIWLENLVQRYLLLEQEAKLEHRSVLWLASGLFRSCMPIRLIPREA